MWSSDQAKLTSLVENAEEFAAFYVEFAKKVSSAALEEREDGMDVDDGDGAHHAEEEEVPEHPKQETPTSVDDFPPASSSRVRPRDIAVGKDLLEPRRRSRNQANLVGSLHVAVRPHDLYLRVRF